MPVEPIRPGELLGIDLSGLEKRFGVVVVGRILVAFDEEDLAEILLCP